MSDLAINFATGDIDLDATGNPYLVTGQKAIAQSLWIRLRMLKGEWFLDQREGVPWFDEILVASPDMDAIEAILRKAILATPGVEAVTAFSLDFNRQARSLAIHFEARTTDGSTITSADYGVPFIVTGA